MTNRSKLGFLVAFTLGAALANGCEIGNAEGAYPPKAFGNNADDGAPTYCVRGTKPCNGSCIYQHDQCPIAAVEHEPEDLQLTMDGSDYCDENPESWGCEGQPCVHGNCWDGDQWVTDACEGIEICDGVVTDPGVCCFSDDCDAG